MKQLSRSRQKLLKTIHLISAALWMTGVVIMSLLPVISKGIATGDALYMYDRIYHFIDMKVVTPAAVSTLATGLVYSIFTGWGFFRHGWLIYKWAITLLLICAGTFYLGPMVTKMLHISDAERMAALKNPYYRQGLAIGLWAAVANAVLLISAVVVSVYKPLKNIRKQGRNLS